MSIMTQSSLGKPHRYRATVVVGAPDMLLLPYLVFPARIIAVPGAGGSVRVEASISSQEDIDAGTAIWEAWGPGDATTQASASISPPPTALRCTATGADATWEVML